MSSSPTVIKPDVLAAIGNTPLIRLKGPSERTGCEILGKAEFMNPGQSVKDRAALYIVKVALNRGQLRPGGTVVEGTAGNTGIGIAVVGNALGLKSVIVIPDTQSQEKKDTLRLLGAQLIEVPAVPYRDPNNYVKISERLAKQLAKDDPKAAIWANQFDNVANRQAHQETTGAEIWEQTEGLIDGFTCSVGTGGTLAGVALALKARNPDVLIAAADPMGAAIYSWIKTGELKMQGDSITEGIGQSRVTANLKDAPIDDAYQIPDEEALPLIFELLEHEGLCLGGSSGINVAGAIRMAEQLGPGHKIVTILADYGTRYQSKLFNPEFLRSKTAGAMWLGRRRRFPKFHSNERRGAARLHRLACGPSRRARYPRCRCIVVSASDRRNARAEFESAHIPARCSSTSMRSRPEHHPAPHASRSGRVLERRSKARHRGQSFHRLL
jgi:cysteine synthase A